MKSRWMRHLMARPLLLAAILCLLIVAGAAAQEGDPQRGGTLFNENCAVCHGQDGRGRIGANINEFPGIDVSAALQEIISKGASGTWMPAWGQAYGGPLADQDIADLIAYIEGVFNGTAPIAPAPTYLPKVVPTLADLAADPGAGSVVFQQNCVMCHGDQGQGRLGAALAVAWAGPIPDARIRSTVSSGVEGSLMPAWSQANGGPLSDQDIANVAAYVLSLPPIQGAPTATPAPAGPIGMGTGLIIGGALLALLIVGLVVYYRRA